MQELNIYTRRKTNKQTPHTIKKPSQGSLAMYGKMHLHQVEFTLGMQVSGKKIIIAIHHVFSKFFILFKFN